MNSIPDYTARNAERWQSRDYGNAQKYLNPGEAARQANRQARIVKAIALRAAYRLERSCRVGFAGTPFQRGVHRILDQLLSIRDAENLEALIIRDRQLDGIIEGAHAFESLNLQQVSMLLKLRENAFNHRQGELMP